MDRDTNLYRDRDNKTLAKVANRQAKKYESSDVFDIREEARRIDILKKMELEDIWGISTKSAQRLRKIGIKNPHELAISDPKVICKAVKVTGERIHYELNGISCIPIEEVKNKKTIISSKSFGKKVGTVEELEEAVSMYAARACEKLRAQESRAQGLHVFLRTSPYLDKERRYTNGMTSYFTIPTSNTSKITKEAKRLTSKLFLPNYEYQKIGVVLLNITDAKNEQYSFYEVEDYDKSDTVMGTIDSVNEKFGNRSIFFGAQGINKNWKMRADRKSAMYTTKVDDLPRVI